MIYRGDNMAQTKCVLDIMQENNYIELDNIEDHCSKIPIYRVIATNKIHNAKNRSEIVNKVEEKIKNDEQFIITAEYLNGHIEFCYRNEIESLINDFLQSNEEIKYIGVMTQRLRDWINDHYYNVRAYDTGYNSTNIQNLEIKEDRQRKEELEDEKALELLYSIL